MICQLRKCEGYARLHLCTGYSNSNTVGAGRLRPKFLLLYWLVGKRHDGQKQNLAHERLAAPISTHLFKVESEKVGLSQFQVEIWPIPFPAR